MRDVIQITLVAVFALLFCLRVTEVVAWSWWIIMTPGWLAVAAFCVTGLVEEHRKP